MSDTQQTPLEQYADLIATMRDLRGLDGSSAKLCVDFADYAARLEAELEHTRRTLETVRLSCVELQQELDVAQAGTWQPVKLGETIACGCGNHECNVLVEADIADGVYMIVSSGRHLPRANAFIRKVYLPDGHALCRLVPGMPEPKEDERE